MIESRRDPSRLSLAVLTLALAGIAVLALVGSAGAAGNGAPPPGSMLLTASGHYFHDRSGKVVYLQGSYIGLEFQDYIFGSPKTSDWSIARSVLTDNNANLLRLWTAETTGAVGSTTPLVSPMPWQRSDVCCSLDGGDKFDLSKLDVGNLAQPSIDSPHYFERLRARVLDARAHGIYVSIMLFHSFGWENSVRIPGLDIWSWHPFNAANNVNGVDPDTNHDGSGLELGSTGNSWQPYQDAYIKQVVDSVGDLDNVLYEVCNECWDTPATNAWQASVVNLIHEDERQAGFARHPVGMTSLQDFNNAVLESSDADFISPGGPTLEASPPLAEGSKVTILDMDHILPCSNHNSPDWPWKALMRGDNLWYIYCGPTGDGISYGDPSATEAEVMRRMGLVSAVAGSVDLDKLAPDADPTTCSTTYCLRGTNEDLAFLPSGGSVTLDISLPGRHTIEWIDAATGASVAGGTVGGGLQTLTSPFGSGASVLHVRRGLGRS